MGAGVPRPVQPKSQTQRVATANPHTDGRAATQRQRATPATSTVKPSHRGNSQNHKEKNAAPTVSEAKAVSQRWPSWDAGGGVGRVSVIVFIFLPSISIYGEVTGKLKEITVTKVMRTV